MPGAASSGPAARSPPGGCPRARSASERTADVPAFGRHCACGVVLCNRGSWCPYCRTQLRAFQRAQEALGPQGKVVVAVYSNGGHRTARP
ncbi:peroxiredoxin family protein [Streptomyces sp. IBSBF 2435]|uniref:peroxiredoxin family protein n=1 Tax=Streptomyces sp. IBSBF 2435 TaxID=2903531 RepID=UPI003FA7B41F